ncbi:MAG: peptidase S10 [Vicinamibacterales bacterium]
MSYVATVDEVRVSPGSGPPAATLVVTSYEAAGVADTARRPVIFAFNGGPGASSSPLHLSALGPRRYAIDAAGERVMADNPFSPLDVADLVFLDPVGTGFSRPLPDASGEPFWTVTGDAASVTQAIQAWLEAHGRAASPRFLCGESYGTTRAAQIMDAHAGLGFDGLLLLSVTGGPVDPDEALAMLVPTYAVTAAFHGVVDARGRTPQAIFDDALAFARGPYLTAVKQGPSRSAVETARIAGELSARIGLPAASLREAGLAVDRDTFMKTLLASRGLRTGQLDTRVTGPLAEFAGKTPPYDDPSMPGARSYTRPTPHLYFTQELGVAAETPYVPLNLEVNGRWHMDRPEALQDPLGLVGAAMRRDRRLRVFWVAGLYDLTTPLASGRYLLDRAGIPPGRVTTLAAPTGHMPYDGDAALERFTDAVARFVAAR